MFDETLDKAIEALEDMLETYEATHQLAEIRGIHPDVIEGLYQDEPKMAKQSITDLKSLKAAMGSEELVDRVSNSIKYNYKFMVNATDSDALIITLGNIKTIAEAAIKAIKG